MVVGCVGWVLFISATYRYEYVISQKSSLHFGNLKRYQSMQLSSWRGTSELEWEESVDQEETRSISVVLLLQVEHWITMIDFFCLDCQWRRRRRFFCCSRFFNNNIGISIGKWCRCTTYYSTCCQFKSKQEWRPIFVSLDYFLEELTRSVESLPRQQTMQ